MATTTNMGLILPDVSTTVGPTYATNNNTAFTSIDSHDHTSGNGVLIPTSGLSMNGTLQFNDNAITELTRSNFTSQASALTGTNHLQVISNELHFVDGLGNNVKITNGGALDITSTGGFGGDYTATSASATFTDSTNIYLFRNGSAVESALQFTGGLNSGRQEWKTEAITGNITVGGTDSRMVLLVSTAAARNITLPDPTLGERIIVVKDNTGSCSINNITLVRNGSEDIDGSAASKVLKVNNGTWMVISDGTNWWTISNAQTTPDLAHYQVAAGTVVPNTTTTWAVPTLATTIVETSGITRSTNAISFDEEGWYRAAATLVDHNQTGGTAGNIDIRLYAVTGTAAVFTFPRIENIFVSSVSPGVNSSVEYFFQITDTTDTYNFEWQTDNATGTADVNGLVNFYIQSLGPA